MFFIGNGLPEHARWFVEELGLGDLPVYTDPKRETYALLGMTKGLLRVLGPKSWFAGARARKLGHRQTKIRGDPMQNGGIVLVDRNGKIRWTWIEQSSGQIADPAVVQRELAKLA